MARRAAAKRYAPDAFGLARRKDIGASAALSLHGFAAVDNTTMLALTDAQLAHLAIAATAVEERRRRGWLKDVAERIDRPPRALPAPEPARPDSAPAGRRSLGAPIILP
jgi:hypothetical protein